MGEIGIRTEKEEIVVTKTSRTKVVPNADLTQQTIEATPGIEPGYGALQAHA